MKHKEFWDKVNKSDGCWEWTGTLSYGYGIFQVFDAEKRSAIMAHRYSYQIVMGKIPDGKCVLHKCKNRKCVRPEHLYINIHNREKTHCPKGHPYSGENLKYNGRARRCRECYNAQRMKKYYANKGSK